MPLAYAVAACSVYRYFATPNFCLAIQDPLQGMPLFRPFSSIGPILRIDTCIQLLPFLKDVVLPSTRNTYLRVLASTSSRIFMNATPKGYIRVTLCADYELVSLLKT